MYKKLSYKRYTIHIYEQEPDEDVMILQSSKKFPMSKFYYDGHKVDCKINCSYFTSQYVLGRNQGDEKNDTHDQPGFWDCVFPKGNNELKIGTFKSWDYQTNVKCGFSCGAVLVSDGQDVQLVSTAITNDSKITARNPQTALIKTKEGGLVFVVSEGRNNIGNGLTGLELREFIKSIYDVKQMVLLDGGGSSEMIVNGAIKNRLSDGRERPMFNCLCLYKTEQNKPTEEPTEEVTKLKAKIDELENKLKEINKLSTI